MQTVQNSKRFSLLLCLLLSISIIPIFCTFQNVEFDNYLEQVWSKQQNTQFASNSEYNVTLREWPWISWLWGPNCPIRSHQRLPNTSIASLPVIKAAIEEVKILLDETMTALKNMNLPVGATVSIVYNNEVLLGEGFGQINKSTSEKPTVNTIYNIGSVTKIFTSLALFHSVEKGMVSLDSKVTDYFNDETAPAFNIHNPYSKNEGANAVTLRSLAAQSSGLPREPYCGAYPVNSECEDMNKAEQLNIGALNKIGLFYSPMTNAHYSNLGIALLGRTLQRVWDVEYEEYMTENIFLPLNMTWTGFNYTDQVKENMITGYAVAGPTKNGTYFLVKSSLNTASWSWAAPCGGAFSSTSDFISFFKFIFSNYNNEDAIDDSSVIGKTALSSYFAPGVYLPDGISMYGSGTWETFYANGYWTLTKGGLTASMATSISLIPELKLGISVLLNINSGYQTDKLNAEINKIMVPAIEIALQSIQQSSPLPPNYQQWLGNYGFSSSSIVLQLNDQENNSGVLTGNISIVGDCYFIWDSSQDYNGATAFRYSLVQDTYMSCMSVTSSNNGIAYFTLNDGNAVVSLPDQNANFDFLQKY